VLSCCDVTSKLNVLRWIAQRRRVKQRAAARQGGAVGRRRFGALLGMLQGVVACTDNLPVYHVPPDMRGAGSGLSCLLNPLQVSCTPDPAVAGCCALPASGPPSHGQPAAASRAELVGMFEPITPVSELEAFIQRSVVCTEPRFVSYCRELVGCRLEERADGLDAWRY